LPGRCRVDTVGSGFLSVFCVCGDEPSGSGCLLFYNTFSYGHRPNLSTNTDLSKQELLRYKVGYLFILTQIDKQISSTRVFRHHSICWCVNI
jgi:hypothetical protein